MSRCGVRASSLEPPSFTTFAAPDDSARDPGAGVTGRIGVSVVRVAVDHQRGAIVREQGIFTALVERRVPGDLLVLDGAVGVGLELRQLADVSGVGTLETVADIRRVEVAAR